MNADGVRRVLVLGVLVVGGVLLWRGDGGRGRGVMDQQVYVWQRVWGEGVRDAVGERGGLFGMMRVSAVELTAEESVRAGVDYGLLADIGGPVWLVVRMGSGFGGTLGDEDVVERVEREIGALLEEASGAGCPVVGVEIDYDCATARLGEYAAFVEVMRGRFAAMDWSVTALPSWQENEDGFGALVRAAGQYVLQVHSLELPRRGARDVVLCDPVAARRAVERSGKIGVPFLVALPTYSSLVVFGADGGVVDVVSEDRPAASGEAVLVRSDPVAMGRLVAGWTAERPAAMRGLVWFRLPVAGDAMNWRWATLAAVMEGVEPAGEIRAETVEADGLVTIEVRNAGDGEAAIPNLVRVRWAAGNVVASDGLMEFQDVVDTAGREVVFRGGGGGVLRAGDRVVIGWIRGFEFGGVEVSWEP